MANDYQNRIDNVNPALVQTHGNLVHPKSDQHNEPSTAQSEKKHNIPSSTRLNALDSTLLENEAYQDIDDANFKAEYRISNLEKRIKTLESDIIAAKNINDFQKVDILTMRKHSLQKELKILQKSYGNTDITTKLSEDITNILNIKPRGVNKVLNTIKNFVSNKMLSHFRSFNSSQDVKTALAKLKTLNRNVDELITMQTPYGEADEWYDKLSDYLNTANVIHFQISKTVGTPTFFDTISSIDKEKFSKERKNSSNFNNMAGKKSP